MKDNGMFHTAALAVFITMMLIITVTTEGCATTTNSRDYINYISFSPDGKKILFDRQKDDGPYLIHVYDLETCELSAYQPPPGERWSMGRYSYDGQHIVFSIIPIIETKRDIGNMQIAVMDPTGIHIQKITNSPGVKAGSSFSPSGKKIIFARAQHVRKTGATPAAGYDVYEVDLATGQETRLTEFEFFSISAPFYFGGNDRFIFTALSPGRFPGIQQDDYNGMQKKREELTSKFKGNNIYMMQRGEQKLEPYIVFYDRSTIPMPARGGSLLFFEADGEPETRKYFGFYLYSTDGNHRRIADLKVTSVWSVAASRDGEWLAVVYDLAPQREFKKIVVYKVEDGDGKDIFLPHAPSRIINQGQ